MRMRRWAVALAAGMLLLVGTPVTAGADEADECADAGLINSLLGECGLLGGVLGGSDTGEDPGDESPSTPAPDGDGGSGGSSGSTGSTSGSAGGAGDSTSSGGTGATSSTSGDTGTADATGESTTGRVAGSMDWTAGGTASTAGTESASDLQARDAGMLADPGGKSTSAAGAADPAQVVGPLAHIPSSRADTTHAAGQVTGRALGVALALIAAGLFIAITAVSIAVRRTAAKADA